MDFSLTIKKYLQSNKKFTGFILWLQNNSNYLLNNHIIHVVSHPASQNQRNPVTSRFPKYTEAEARRESATHIRKENTSRIRAKP